MNRTTLLGVIGGGLIVLASFLSGTGWTFSGGPLSGTGDALSGTTALVLFISGIGVALFAVMGRRVLASYFAVAATTIALIWVIAALRADTVSISIKLIVAAVGALLSLAATLGRRE